MLNGFKRPGSQAILGALALVALFAVAVVSLGGLRSNAPNGQPAELQAEQGMSTEPMISADGFREPAADPDPNALAARVVAPESTLPVQAIDEAKDPAGVAPTQRLEFLHNAHDNPLRAYASEHSSAQVAQLNQMFLLRCVGTLLHAQGRAAFPSELTEEESKRYSTNAASPADRIVFSSDGAWYEFFRGDFPLYDMAFDCLALAAGAGGTLEIDTCSYSEELYEQALATFNVQPVSNRR